MGDVHGQMEKMRAVLKRAGYRAGIDRLVLLGDYVDRGPCSREVLDFVIRLTSDGAVALKGNHEEMMLSAMQGLAEGRYDPAHVKQWFANGGEATLRSYRDDRECLLKHLEFIKTLPVLHETGEYVFVHAGLRPGIPIEKQKKEDLIWIREEYIEGYDGQWTVVTGHTPTHYLAKQGVGSLEESTAGDEWAPVIRPRQIFMDTGAAWGGKLSVMELPGGKFWQA